jgi:hypothetical protein
MDAAQIGGKFIFCYVYPTGEAKDPAPFRLKEFVDASYGNWVFTKRAFDKDDAGLKRLRVTSAPTILGMDKFGNAFPRASVVSVAAIRSIVKSTPEQVAKFKSKLVSDWRRAGQALEDGDESKAVKICVEIVTSGRQGYEEIDGAFKKLREIGDKRLKAAEESGDLKALQQIVAEFKETPPGADAEIRLARAEWDKEAAAPAIARLQKVCAAGGERFADQRETAQKLLDEIVQEGIARVGRALKLAAAGETELAKSALRKVQADYKGTEAARRASEALKTIQ